VIDTKVRIPSSSSGLLRTRVLPRLAITGIYLVRGVPRDLQRAARVRAVREGTTLRRVLLQALGDYAAGTWTPQRDHELPESGHLTG
jgi:hypothetical protein